MRLQRGAQLHGGGVGVDGGIGCTGHDEVGCGGIGCRGIGCGGIGSGGGPGVEDRHGVATGSSSKLRSACASSLPLGLRGSSGSTTNRSGCM
ncbi:hypothetical protein EKG83_30660 [Saccharothrix syringae]|uniref:Uncharacterized protein n=1 Tax=Saccharothrix syringae TaxID=103733 RepID=A0A5Q0H4P3_SACSY|nr:hypothetical protein EKG83_30660 [Saccharothrix syringae]